MNAHVTPHKLKGTVSAVCSKSVAHRALIAAALFGNNPVQIEGITPSQDVQATAQCLAALGCKIDGNTTVYPLKNIPQNAVLDCKESGSTLRFLLPVAAALGVDTTFVLSPSLAARPNQKLLQLLSDHGIRVDGYKISGNLQCGLYEIRADISSQYVSGLLFALSLLSGKSRLVLQGQRVSQNYIDLTLRVLQDFGVEIVKTADGFEISGGTQRCTPLKYAVEGDWSNFAFVGVAAALGSEVTVTGLNLHSLQGDKKVLDLLKKVGAKVTETERFVTVCGGSLHPFFADATDIPDAVPALSVLAAFCDGTTQICGVERLKNKESDRLSGVLEMLSKAGISAQYSDGVLSIVGGIPKGAVFHACNDHRMAMSQTILALYAKGNSVVTGAECVAKSYPNFFEDVNKLGDNCVYLER